MPAARSRPSPSARPRAAAPGRRAPATTRRAGSPAGSAGRAGKERAAQERSPAWVKALRLDADTRALLAATIAELAALRDDAARGRGRVVDAFADALAGAAFSEDGIARAVERRSADEARATKRRVAALKRVHKALLPEQRALLAVLVRAGLLPLA